jgi:hypothetical protein
MRHSKVIPLDDSRAVTLNELKVSIARQLAASGTALKGVDVRAVLTDRFHEVAGLLGDCIVMPEGETLDDLAFSEVAEVIDGLLEINQAFLSLLGLAGLDRQTLAALMAEPVEAPIEPSTTSTAPASGLSNEATAE